MEIQGLGSEVELVVMLGPNGTGKSSVFDAFLQWARAQGRRSQRSVANEYFDSETGSYGKPEIVLHGSNDSRTLQNSWVRWFTCVLPTETLRTC